MVVGTLAAAVYLPALDAPFVQDDHFIVAANPIVDRFDLGEIYTTHYWEGPDLPDTSLYRPTTIATFAAEHALGGGPDAKRAHTVNVLLHAATTLLLFAVARRLRMGALGATAVALLFGLHPLHSEAVIAVVGRAEILATGFSLAAILAYTYAGDWPGAVTGTSARHRAAAWSTAAFLFLALTSKETALATVLLLPAIDLCFRAGGDRPTRARRIERAAALAPAAAAALGYVALRIAALETVVSVQTAHVQDNPLAALSFAERLPSALGLLARWVFLHLAPFSLSADYSGGAVPIEAGLFRPLPLVGASIVAVGLAIAARRVRLALRGSAPNGDAFARLAFGVIAFALPYAIVGNLIVPIGTVFAERLTYFPSVGFAWLGGVLIAFLAGPSATDVAAHAGTRDAFGWSPTRRTVYAIAILALLSVAFGLLTVARSATWRDEATLWRSAARVHPTNTRAWWMLGKLAVDSGRPAEALERFERVLEHHPASVASLADSGVALARLGRFAEAETRLRKALELAPDNAGARRNLALVLQRTGRAAEAEREVRKALLEDPRSATGWATLGNLALAREDGTAAADAYRRAIALGRADLADRLAIAERAAGARTPPTPEKGHE